MKYRLMFLLMILITSAFAQGEKQTRKGNDLYNSGKFNEALLEYKQAQAEAPTRVEPKFNQGAAQYRTDKHDDAIESFKSAAESATDPKIKANAFHNLGNAYLKKNMLQESADAYKSALRINPDDNDTRYNLSYVMKKLNQNKQNQDQKQNQDKKDQDKKDKGKQDQQKQDQKKDDKDKKEKGDQDKKDDGNQDKKDSENNKGEKDKDQNPKPENKPGQGKGINKEEAKRMLDALNNEEKKVQDKLKKKKGKAVRVDIEKDW